MKALVASLFLAVSAFSSTAGIDTALPYTSTKTVLRAMPVTMSRGTIRTISIYHNGLNSISTGAYEKIVCGVYNDDNGKPGTLIGITSIDNVAWPEGWQELALRAPVNVQDGQHVWLAWGFTRSPGVRYQGHNSTIPYNGRAENNTEGFLMPNEFGPSSVGTYSYSIYCTYDRAEPPAISCDFAVVLTQCKAFLASIEARFHTIDNQVSEVLEIRNQLNSMRSELAQLRQQIEACEAAK